MDDLIAFVRLLLAADPEILRLWALYAPGADVSVRAPGGKRGPVYPEFILTGSPGRDIPIGEGVQMFIDGTLKLTTLTRDTDDASGKDEMWALANRATVVLCGDEQLGIKGLKDAEPPGAPDAQGNDTPPIWHVAICRLINPSGPLDDADPLVSRHLATYKVTMYRP